jgi:site-specific DNA-methyltransferase (adenine-specific)
MIMNENIQIIPNNIYNMDCMEGMQCIPDNSIDCIICDLPYGTTACKWDNLLPLNDYVLVKKKKYTKEDYLLFAFKNGLNFQDAINFFEKNKKLGLWSHYKRIIKDNGAIVLFGSEPFSTCLRNSNMEMYKYDWIWKKNTVDGFFNSKCRQLKTIENISVFSKKQARAKGDNMVYLPQGLVEVNSVHIDKRKNIKDEHNYYRKSSDNREYVQQYKNYPIEILEFNRDTNKLHPTQKPVQLLEYLIKTYTHEGDVVLDNCMGSGSTAIACINTNRNYIGFELDVNYYNICLERIVRKGG